MNIVDKIDVLNFSHEIQQLRAENLTLKKEIKALRALLVSSRQKKFV